MVPGFGLKAENFVRGSGKHFIVGHDEFEMSVGELGGRCLVGRQICDLGLQKRSPSFKHLVLNICLEAVAETFTGNVGFVE